MSLYLPALCRFSSAAFKPNKELRMDKECFRHELRKALGHLCRLLIVRYLGAIVRARTTILLILAPTISWAENLDLQAQTFQQMYESICVENIKNLGDLKRRLKESSKLPPQEAANFSGGTTGKHGKYKASKVFSYYLYLTKKMPAPLLQNGQTPS